MDSRITIERMTNGYTVRVCDPKIEEANRKRDTAKGGDYPRWRDPMREYVFKTIAEATAFVTKVADKALPADDYESAFDAAVDEDDGDE
jgi:hypothetical protein